MDPFTAMLIAQGGMALLGAGNSASQKKQQMLSAAAETRYAPWTGNSGTNAFNSAEKEDPTGDLVKQAANIAGNAFATSAANAKTTGLQNAQASVNPLSGGSMNQYFTNQTQTPWYQALLASSKTPAQP